MRKKKAVSAMLTNLTDAPAVAAKRLQHYTKGRGRTDQPITKGTGNVPTGVKIVETARTAAAQAQMATTIITANIANRTVDSRQKAFPHVAVDDTLVDEAQFAIIGLFTAATAVNSANIARLLMPHLLHLVTDIMHLSPCLY